MSKTIGQPTYSSETEEHSKVIDFAEARAQKMEDKRRKTERVFMNHFLGVYCVTGINSMHQIEMVDLSEEGCSFQTPDNPEKSFPAEPGRNMPIRLYFSQDNYLEIYVTVQNTKKVKQNSGRDAYIRYGCSVDEATSTYPAYQSFVRFLKAYAQVSQKDEGNINVFFV